MRGFHIALLHHNSDRNPYPRLAGHADPAPAGGAQYVIVLGHMGNAAEYMPWTYADVIAHTSGIDAFLDGHSHDRDKVVMRNKDGAEVVRQACGTKMEAIGWLRISAKDGSVDTGLYVWGNSVSAPELLGLQNDMTDEVEKTAGEVNEKLTAAVAYTSVDLRINDPEAADENGRPIRIVRRAETNLGDLCADACLDQSGADIAFVSGGCVRVDIPRGGYHHEFRPDNFVSHLQITNKRMKPRRILQDIKPEDCWAGSEGQITAPDRHRSQSARHS